MKRIRYTFFAGLLFTFTGMAQPFDLVLNSAESGTVIHQARNSITFAAGYSYTPNGGTMTAKIVNPIVTGDMNYSEKISSSSYTINTSLAVGSPEGNMQIAGIAQYTVPLQLPGGTAGVKPDLSLVYTSVLNNGIMGTGWKISGLSEISRVVRNIYFDTKANPVNGTISDGYAIDGKRLILTGGTYGASNSTYGTEQEEFSKIVAHGTTGYGPLYFTVYTKSGLIYEYGNTSDSRILKDGSCILSWKLNKISDRYNNYITFSYLASDDERPVYMIEYTGNSGLSKNPFARIEFFYKRRDDNSTYVYGEKKFTRRLLLDQVKITNNDQLFKRYELDYCLVDNHSMLQKVTEYSSRGQAFNPLVFTYSDSKRLNSLDSHPSQPFYSNSTKERFFQGDFNGDGRTDFVTIESTSSASDPGDLSLYLANRDGKMEFASSMDIEDDTDLLHLYNIIPADFNADGMTDLLFIGTDYNPDTFDKYLYTVCLSKGTSFWGRYEYLNYYDLKVDTTFSSQRVVDYNGDGKMEILAFNDSRYELYSFDFPISYLNGVKYYTSFFNFICRGEKSVDFIDLYPGKDNYKAPITVDFNRDGCTDILGTNIHIREYALYGFKNPDSSLKEIFRKAHYETGDRIDFGDFNGDGVSDIIKVHGDENPQWWFATYTNDGFVEEEITGLSGFNLEESNNQWLFCDVNGDGKDDFLFYGKGQDTGNRTNRINIAISNGNGTDFTLLPEYISPVRFDMSVDNEKTQYFHVGDYNGDGFDEFFYSKPGNQRCFSFFYGTRGKLLSNVIDGMGVKTNLLYGSMIEYTRLRSSGDYIYTKYTDASYPVMDYIAPVSLVYNLTTDDGIGGLISHDYTYKGAKVHLQGKGFMGFSKIIDKNEDTGITEERTYSFHSSRYFPRLDSVVTKYGSTILSTVTNKWAEVALGNNRIFPYVSVKSVTDNLKGLTETTTAGYNSYGNPTSVAVNYGGGHTQTTTYQYNDERVSSWLIGRPTTITETSVRDSQTKTFTTTRTYFTTNNSPDTDRYNSGDDSYWQLDREYDSFGNLWKEHKLTTGLGTQTTVYAYDTDHGVNLTSVTDPAGNQASYTYYPTTGLLHTETDRFGNENTYSYNSADQLSSVAPDIGITKTITSSLSFSGGPSNARYYIQKSGNDGFVTKKWYDKLNRELRTETEIFGGLVSKTDKQYNSKGQLYHISEPSTGTPSYWNTIYYDNYGRITSQDPYYGATTSFSYSGGTTTRTVNSRNYTTTVDAAGMATNRTDPGGSITYTYWGDGTLKSTETPGNVVSSTTYDKNGNQLTLNDPSAGTITKTWYGTGQLKTRQNGRGQTTTYTYLANGLLDKYTSPEGETDYTYNADNQVRSITSPGGTSGVSRSFTYYTNGLVNTITETIDGVSNTITYEYDSKGRLYRKYFNGTSVYEQYDYYSTNGYLYRIRFTADGSTSTVWQLTNMDAYQRITQASVGGITATRSYNPSTNLLSQIAASGVQQYDYSFDANTGNLTSRANHLKSKTENFGYDTDDLDRLASVSGPVNASVSYTSNKKGNILTKSDAGTYAYEDTPYAVSSISNARNISTTEQSLDYYSFEKVSNITEGTKTADFVYNADHQRIRIILKNNGTTTKTHWYFGSSYEREDVGGVVTQYIWIGGDAYTAYAVAKKTGSGTWTVYNIFRDHLGTITHLKTGSTVNEYSFDAWGRRRDKDSWSYTLDSEPSLFADRGFTGHEYLEDFNLYNMNGRLYDPVVGRFLSPDPYVQNPDFTQSFNRYSYCLNNPLKYADPNGEFFLDPIVWLGNYLINWLDNTLNKEMSAKEAFKQTPIAINQNYSPSGNQFSNPQAEAQKTARTIEKRGVEIEQNISNIGQNYGEALRDATNEGGEFVGTTGIGFSFELAFPKFVTKKLTDYTGAGIDFGMIRDKKGLGFYATTKTTKQSGVACSAQVECFGAFNRPSSPNINIDRSYLVGPGYETGLGIGPVGGSYSVSNAADYGRISTFQMISLSFGFGLDAGFVNWNTNTYTTGN